MSFNIDDLAISMNKLFDEIVIKEKMIILGDIKNDLGFKSIKIQNYLRQEEKKFTGRVGKEFYQELNYIGNGFKDLKENFDDKLMIFLVGDGNAGKSTILNCLVGEKVAETGVLPSTWKIDVYSEEISKEKVIIKYDNGKNINVHYDEAKRIIENEELKTKGSKKIYYEELKKEMKKLKTKEEREEMKKFLAKKYVYKSNIAEVRWPVAKSNLLKKSLLVDTPGRNQDLNSIDQVGSLGDYYHKADGVIWVLDGNTIASENSIKEFNILHEQLSSVGGTRDNIIGVVNKMDLILENGGVEGFRKVKKSAIDIYGKRFSNIVYVSGKVAFSGIINKNVEERKNSGIEDLQKAIKELFIEKADSIRNGAKLQGRNILKNKLIDKINVFLNEIESISTEFFNKDEKIRKNTKSSISSIERDIENFFKSYLADTSRRISLHIDKLSEGYGADFIRDKMYEIPNFNTKKKRFEENKYTQINNDFSLNKKITKISEYKYIDVGIFTENSMVSSSNTIKNINLTDIKTFTPVEVDGIFSALGNVFGKIGFMFRKSGIRNSLNSKIKDECDKIEEDMKKNLTKQIDSNEKYCLKLLNSNFEAILFKINDLEEIKEKILELNKSVQDEKEKVDLREILNTK